MLELLGRDRATGVTPAYTSLKRVRETTADPNARLDMRQTQTQRRITLAFCWRNVTAASGFVPVSLCTTRPEGVTPPLTFTKLGSVTSAHRSVMESIPSAAGVVHRTTPPGRWVAGTPGAPGNWRRFTAIHFRTYRAKQKTASAVVATGPAKLQLHSLFRGR